MSKTYYDEACRKVEGFEKMASHFLKSLVIAGRSRSTHENYLRQMAKMALHCGKTPLEMEPDDIDNYLYYLVNRDTDSQSSFKHLVYGLRKLYKLNEYEHLHISLPSINRPQKLPIIFSVQEIKRLLMAPRALRDRLLLGIIYDTGLRISEAASLLIEDVDLDRQQLLVRQSKCKRDRYIPFSSHIARGVRNYLKIDQPRKFLFERSQQHKGIPLYHARIRIIMKDAMKAAGIQKRACVHSLRHSYATHQLEAGQTIYGVKHLLGHADIKNTEVYLHLARVPEQAFFGMLDKLYEKLKT
jgi:site-specific recombinase XerD